MPEIISHTQYFHLVKPLLKRNLKKLAHVLDQVETRGFTPFLAPSTLVAQVTALHIRGAILRVPGQHPHDTRWSCVDPAYAFSLVLVTDSPYTQDEMRGFDDEAVTTIWDVPHAGDEL